jgi:hypothetical protein
MAFRLLRIGLVLAALASPAASAAQPPPGSAVSQYVEVIPIASGPTVSGAPAAPAAGGPAAVTPVTVTLSPAARKALTRQPRRQARVLREVATSPRFGAPQARLPGASAARAEAAPEGVLPSPGALVGGAGSRLPALLGILLGTLAAAGGWAAIRARP